MALGLDTHWFLGFALTATPESREGKAEGGMSQKTCLIFPMMKVNVHGIMDTLLIKKQY